MAFVMRRQFFVATTALVYERAAIGFFAFGVLGHVNPVTKCIKRYVVRFLYRQLTQASIIELKGCYG